jgi:hypothetical protein
MRIIVEWMNLGTTTRLLTVLIIGIAQVSVAQVVSGSTADAPLPANTKAGQHPSPAGVRRPEICVTSAEQAAHLLAHGPRTVTLSWHASIPATRSDADAISCYLIYRTADYFDPRSAPIIGVTRAPDTTYVDLHVEPGSYHYAVRAVSVAGAKSDFSRKLPVNVPR